MFDPLDELRYRLRLAREYLRDAERSFGLGDWRATVASSQLSAENSAKAVIAFYRIPSWTHDPSDELLSLLTTAPRDIETMAVELADIVRTLAPEHGRATYGEPERGLTPWEIYSREDAEKVLRLARRALDLATGILTRLGVNTDS